MLDELCRILNNDSAITNARSAWHLYVPKIISQAQRENGARISSRCSSLIINDDDGKLKLISIAKLMGFFFSSVYICTHSKQSFGCSLSPPISSTRQQE